MTEKSPRSRLYTEQDIEILAQRDADIERLSRSNWELRQDNRRLRALYGAAGEASETIRAPIPTPPDNPGGISSAQGESTTRRPH
jgi:hypothetical protein